jgi:hypothetical protein
LRLTWPFCSVYIRGAVQGSSFQEFDEVPLPSCGTLQWQQLMLSTNSHGCFQATSLIRFCLCLCFLSISHCVAALGFLLEFAEIPKQCGDFSLCLTMLSHKAASSNLFSFVVGSRCLSATFDTPLHPVLFSVGSLHLLLVFVKPTALLPF